MTTWSGFQATCNKYEDERRLVITVSKLGSILTKTAEYLSHQSVVTRSQLNALVGEVKVFNLWKDLQLQDSFGISVASAGLFKLVYELTPETYRTAQANQTESELDTTQGSETKCNELFNEAREMTQLLSMKRIVGEHPPFTTTGPNAVTNTVSLFRMKQGQEGKAKGSKKCKQDDLDDPEVRAKALPKMVKFMVKNKFKRPEDIPGGYYKALYRRSTQDEIKMYLNP